MPGLPRAERHRGLTWTGRTPHDSVIKPTPARGSRPRAGPHASLLRITASVWQNEIQGADNDRDAMPKPRRRLLEVEGCI